MERLTKIGRIEPKHSKNVTNSRIGLGFEKLDRDVFDPEKAYDKVGALGVKWIRIQSGWERTEKVKGVYDFAWLDKIVDNLIDRNLKPWINLCYGNGIYGHGAEKVFGAVGCPPIFSEEQKAAWTNYIKALCEHFKDRVEYYEVWNEPDGIWCWKHGVNATELGNFTVDTAKAIRSVYPDAKIIGGVLCLRNIAYINEALKTGMCDWIDYISFHEYTADETNVFERVDALAALAEEYNPNIGIIQGESGSQSKSGGAGALWRGSWTPQKQAKQLARHTIADLMTDVLFTSYFSCMDMIEALGGTVGDKNSYLDYAYFGVIGAEFDENGYSSGEYKEKPSYYTLQNICSFFAEDFEVTKMPIVFFRETSERIFAADLDRSDLTIGAFRRDGGTALAYWHPSDIMTTLDFESTVSFEVYSPYDTVKVVDVMDGNIYSIPEDIATRDEFGTYKFTNMPVKDTPLILVFGEF